MSSAHTKLAYLMGQFPEMQSFMGKGVITELDTTAAAATGVNGGKDECKDVNGMGEGGDEGEEIEVKVPNKDGNPVAGPKLDETGEGEGEGEGEGKPSTGHGHGSKSPCKKSAPTYKVGDKVRVKGSNEVKTVTAVTEDGKHILG